VAAEVDRLQEEIDVLVERDSGRLKVGASTTPGTFLLPPVLESDSCT
jgi:hypothetical protein